MTEEEQKYGFTKKAVFQGDNCKVHKIVNGKAVCNPYLEMDLENQYTKNQIVIADFCKSCEKKT